MCSKCLDCNEDLVFNFEVVGGICALCLYDTGNLPPVINPSPEDMFIWPDKTTCSREEYDRGEFSFKSDDYAVAPAN